MTIKICKERNRLLSSTNHLIVLGGPGSGKTTIALIKANKEINTLSNGQKILFLSFARATVARVLEGAFEMTDKDSLKSIEISTYHSFFWNILRSHGYLLNKNYPFKVLSPANEAVRMAQIKSPEDRKTERKKTFKNEGILAFDLFAPLTRELILRSKRLRKIISRAYPVIIVDEFQDTNIEEWEVIKLLGERSRVIALADAGQQIYGFRGADPARIDQFIQQFNPDRFDFEHQNHRSSDTDINVFGNDIRTGENQNKTYNDVKIVYYRHYGNSRHEMYSLKTKVIEGIRRVKDITNWSIAILVPTKLQMLQASDYFSSQRDKLPPIEHNVSIDAEGPELAGILFAKLLEKFKSPEEIKKQIIIHIINHLKGKKGSEPPTQKDLALSIALEKFLQTNKISGKRRKQLIKEIELISDKKFKLKSTGNPWYDWLGNLDLFDKYASEEALKNTREDAKYLRLLHKGSHLREALNRSWREYGCYHKTSEIFRETIQQENFSPTIKKTSRINIMTIHKSKGKQFHEVFLFEGYWNGRFIRKPDDQKNVAQSRLTLRVAVTRAISRATILSPNRKKCEILFDN